MVNWYLDTRELSLRYRVRNLHLAREQEDQTSRKGRTIPKERAGYGRKATNIQPRIPIIHTQIRPTLSTLPARQYPNHGRQYRPGGERKTYRQYGG